MTSYKELCAAYPIASVGDPFDRTDWENTKGLNAADVCQVRFESEDRCHDVSSAILDLCFWIHIEHIACFVAAAVRLQSDHIVQRVDEAF